MFPCHGAALDALGGRPTEHHMKRDAAIVKRLQRLWQKDSIPGGAVHGVTLGFLPSCGHAQASELDFSSDGVHLSCRYHPFPLQFRAASAPISSIVANYGLDCTDPIDVTNIRMLLTSMCPGQF